MHIFLLALSSSSCSRICDVNWQSSLLQPPVSFFWVAMAELQPCRTVLKCHASSIERIEYRASKFFDESVTDSQREKQDNSTTLQSKCFDMEGQRGSFQFEAVLSPRLSFKRAKWEEPHTEISFNRHPAGTNFHTQTVNVGSFVSNLPKSQPQAHSGVPLDDHVSPPIPGQCGVFMGQQLPLACSPQVSLAVSQVPSHTTFASPKSGAALSVTQNDAPEQRPVSGISVSEILAELGRERKKNAELIGRLSLLEAQLEPEETESTDDAHGGGEHVAGDSLPHGSMRTKKIRRMEKTVKTHEEDIKKLLRKDIGTKQGEGLQILRTDKRDGCSGPCSVVTWMSHEEVQLPDFVRLNTKDADSELEVSMESDDSDVDDDSSTASDDENGDDDARSKYYGRSRVKGLGKGDTIIHDLCAGIGDSVMNSVGRSIDVKEDHNGGALLYPVANEDRYVVMDSDSKTTKRKRKKRRDGIQSKAVESNGHDRGVSSCKMVPYRFVGMISSLRKAPKIAFCPREVKRIMESGVLALKNAQSHTMRKIIVFASLGIRHGCEDLYELDFNHFSIMRRGEPFVTSKDPGEHVLYDQPNVRRRIFYPNRQNPILCPVRILDEERAMRPIGPSCPSYLFLCIKYGGRTRNLPQNEYVRQRMGRNKLKSFGPLMCQMALLVHVRTGSFFFKALGITLLFMAGFASDLVRKETKYHNLDLLQKYYRSDEDAKGELLFHACPPFYPQVLVATQTVQAKASVSGRKSAGKKQPPPLLSKPSGSQTVAAHYLPPPTVRTSSAPPFGSAVFPFIPGPMGCPLSPAASTAGITSIHVATTSATTPISLVPATLPPLPPPPFGVFHTYPVQCPPTSGFVPMPLWPTVSSFTPGPFPTPPYGYQTFVHSTQYGSNTSPSYYGQPFFPFPPAGVKGSYKKDNGLEESDSDLDSSSSGADQKSQKAISSDSKDA